MDKKNNFLEKILATGNKPLQYITGKNLLNEDIYYFVFFNENQLLKLERAIKSSKDINLIDFGDIVEKGKGLPTAKIIKTLAEKYHIDVQSIVNSNK